MLAGMRGHFKVLAGGSSLMTGRGADYETFLQWATAIFLTPPSSEARLAPDPIRGGLDTGVLRAFDVATV